MLSFSVYLHLGTPSPVTRQPGRDQKFSRHNRPNGRFDIRNDYVKKIDVVQCLTCIRLLHKLTSAKSAVPFNGVAVKSLKEA